MGKPPRRRVKFESRREINPSAIWVLDAESNWRIHALWAPGIGSNYRAVAQHKVVSNCRVRASLSGTDREAQLRLGSQKLNMLPRWSVYGRYIQHKRAARASPPLIRVGRQFIVARIGSRLTTMVGCNIKNHSIVASFGARRGQVICCASVLPGVACSVEF